MAATPLDNNGAGKEERREEQAAPEVVHEGEIGRGEWPAGCNGDWRGEGQPGRHRIGGRERHLVPCAVGIWRGLSNSLERGRRAVCASNGV